jgi:hypothetical protein
MSVFAPPKPLISLGVRFLLDEYRAAFPVNVTSPPAQLKGQAIRHIR